MGKKGVSLFKESLMKIKSSKLFNKFRHSKLNPYHRGVVEIEASNLEEAKRIAREKAIERIKNSKNRKTLLNRAEKKSLT